MKSSVTENSDNQSSDILSFEKNTSHPRLKKEIDDSNVDMSVKILAELKESVTKRIEYAIDKITYIQEKKLNDTKSPMSSVSGPRKHAGKEFKARKSRLTELFEIPDIRTLYNIFVAFFAMQLVSVLCDNYFSSGSMFNASLFVYAFGQVVEVFQCWICMFCYSTLAFNWKLIAGKSSAAVLAMYFTTQFAFFIAFGFACLHLNFPPASALIVLCEGTRMTLKVHSYFRYFYKTSFDEEKKCEIPTLEHYIYFLFAPTLIYKGAYPRCAINISSAVKHFLETLGVILYIYILFSRYLEPQFRSIGQQPNNLEAIILCIANCMIPGMLLFVFGFFGLLHCWMNAWADLLGFADRMFYRDWWSSHSFGEFYPKWNGVVHDWILNYAYLDVIRFAESLNFKPSTAKLIGIVFSMQLSAFVHEYIISCALGFFYPVLWVIFGGPGMFLIALPRQKTAAGKNIALWSCLLLGNGILATLYCREFYMRDFASSSFILSKRFWHDFTSVHSFKTFDL